MHGRTWILAIYNVRRKVRIRIIRGFAAQTQDRRSAQQIRGSCTQSSDSDHPRILLRKPRIPSRTRPTILHALKLCTHDDHTSMRIVFPTFVQQSTKQAVEKYGVSQLTIASACARPTRRQLWTSIALP